MTNESLKIAEQLDQLKTEARQQILQFALRLISAYSDAGSDEPVVTKPKVRKPFRRRARSRKRQPCDVISLADRRAELDERRGVGTSG